MFQNSYPKISKWAISEKYILRKNIDKSTEIIASLITKQNF